MGAWHLIGLIAAQSDIQWIRLQVVGLFVAQSVVQKNYACIFISPAFLFQFILDTLIRWYCMFIMAMTACGIDFGNLSSLQRCLNRLSTKLHDRAGIEQSGHGQYWKGLQSMLQYHQDADSYYHLRGLRSSSGNKDALDANEAAERRAWAEYRREMMWLIRKLADLAMRDLERVKDDRLNVIDQLHREKLLRDFKTIVTNSKHLEHNYENYLFDVRMSAYGQNDNNDSPIVEARNEKAASTSKDSAQE